jgi:hypothetical protein
MASPNERPATRSDGSANLSARVGQLSVRVERLTRQVESLNELVRGQNELLQRQYRLQAGPAPAGQAPAARLGAEADPAGPDETDGYADLVIRIRALVRSVVPFGARVAVASKGDEELLLLEGRRGWHFPQVEGGQYAGHHPLDSDEAIRGLDALRSRGAEYFVLPETAFWWLDHYSAFAEHLTERYRVALRNADACLIFDLRSEGKSA